MRFSIRELLVAIATVAFVLGGFAMYGVFGASLVALVIGASLVVHGFRNQRTWIARIGIALSVPSLCTAGAIIAAWLLLGIGPIYSAAAFPIELKQMAEIGHADIADAKVAGLGSFIDSEHVWRLSLASEQLDRVVTYYGLVTVPPEKVPPSFWRAFPRWWRPSHNTNSRYLATPGFPAQSRGPDGDHCFAMYDSQSQQLYVWYKFNF